MTYRISTIMNFSTSLVKFCLQAFSKHIDL
jgi:hypothetical protein